jgi:hypothetical protein
MSLTACPFLEPPLPLAPLPIPKVKEQKNYTDITTACRIVKDRFETTYIYDTQNQLSRIEYKNGNISQYTYSTDGYLQQVQFNSPPPYTSGSTVYEYDSNKILSKYTYTTKPNQFGDTFQEVYFYEKGRLLKWQYITRIGPNPSVIEYKVLAYDSQGRHIEYLYPSINGKKAYSVYIKYDERGNEIEVRDNSENPQVVTIWYDKNPNPLYAISRFRGVPASVGDLIWGSSPNNKIYQDRLYTDGRVTVEFPETTYLYNASGFPVEMIRSGVQSFNASYAGCIQ